MRNRPIINRVTRLERQQILHNLPIIIDAPENTFKRAKFDNHTFTSMTAVQNYCELMGLRATPQIIENVPKTDIPTKPTGVASTKGGGVDG
ncbi:MAG: hypothetical protein ABF723_04040 [Lentilactobacillus hilgardii]|mgnify:CR=1 FL=1|uniref:hypothetical protein n=1 Tax=Lactobacillaceae TaxID=33958 RepID=UPI001CC1C7E1|nr:hypothetical protein [Lentilactobacillus hilgardii]MBZ2200230.1 hypothetical protein [Lentilactobacillus hilgardii]MBZ2203354.1 hypothetical protein [Lentilactobacillus hilgardii]